MAAVMVVKRGRTLTNGIDSVDVAGRAGRNKRPRRSTPPESTAASSPNEPSSVSSEKDASDSEDDNQDHEQEVLATQQVQRHFNANAKKQNVATDSGIIEEIQCINFMCHEHLKITLGPLINFIIGHNGSGKSAVLTALTICLGGKATATNRAQNLKSLIKEGKDHSTVIVRIKNQGPLAYHPLKYGDSIIVERHFSRSGTSGFKIKDRNGRIVTTKKADLEDILDAFSMQIDNPMNVLTQDMARQFLNHSTPKDKYKFFLQGTQLETLNRDYQQIEQTLEVMNSKAEVKREDLAVLRKRFKELANKALLARKLEDLRAKEKELTHQILWANVQEEEVGLREAESEVERVQGLVDKRTSAVEEASRLYETADQASEVARQNVTDLTTELEPAHQLAQDAKSTFDETKQKLVGLLRDERNAGGNVKTTTRHVEKLKTDIEQHRQRQAEADDGLHAEKSRQFEEARKLSKAAKAALASHNENLPTLKSELKTAEMELRGGDSKMHKARENKRQVQSNINTLQRGARNWIDAYRDSRGLERLLRTIESESRFREQPIGPIGRFVKLLKPQWGYILEKQFGGVLNAFVVTSKGDQTILSELMNRVKWQSTVFIGTKKEIDTRSNEPDLDLSTWMRALKIENYLVLNQLIINQSIEQTVLIESRQEGVTFMHSRGPQTRNVKMCFTFADGDKRKGRVINYTANGGINDSPIAEFDGNLRMQADEDAQIAQERDRLQQIEQELRDMEDANRDLLARVSACKAQEADHHKQGKTLRLEMQRAQDKAEQLEEELNNATPDAAAIEVLEEELKTAEEELERVSGVFEDMVVQRDQLNQEQKVNLSSLNEAQREEQSLEFKLEKAKATVRQLQDQRELELKKKNQAITQVAAAEDNKAVWVRHVIQAQVSVETATKEAETVCPVRVAVPEGQNPDSLHRELQNKEATRIASEKELGGSQQELIDNANAAKAKHISASEEFEEIMSLRNSLATTLNKRRERWKQFRSGISVRARVTFNYLLSERKFRGTLNIDHKKGLLDIHIQPDSTERSGDGRQTKTLSGGEKSYSTVCLLLSLWDAMGSPIRCLDEFDVFMDSVNRERSMHMIIQAARRSIGRQFIFITPQSMNNVKQTADVKIIKMSDPERGQTALNVQRS